jgi:hypothetical protein
MNPQLVSLLYNLSRLARGILDNNVAVSDWQDEVLQQVMGLDSSVLPDAAFVRKAVISGVPQRVLSASMAILEGELARQVADTVVAVPAPAPGTLNSMFVDVPAAPVLETTGADATPVTSEVAP